MMRISATTGTLGSRLTSLVNDFTSLKGVVDALANLDDGTGIATVIQQESEARIEGDTALGATLGLLGAKSGDASAFILDLDNVKVSPTESMADRYSAISARHEANQAAIQAESQARANAISAEATARNSLAATLRQESAASIETERLARVAADSAEATARTTLAATLNASISSTIQQEATTRANADGVFTQNFTLLGAKSPDGKSYILNQNTVQVGNGVSLGQRLSGLDATISGVSASVVNEANTRAAQDGALSNQISVTNTNVNGLSASVNTLSQSVNGIAARWGVELNVNGYVSGVVLNNSAGRADFTVMANIFRVINPVNGNILQPFVVEDGIVKITALFAGSINADQITTGKLNVGTLIWDGSLTTGMLQNNAVTRVASRYGPVSHDLRNQSQGNWIYVASASVGGRVEITFTNLPQNAAVKIDYALEHIRTGGSDDYFYARVVRSINQGAIQQVGDTFTLKARNGYTLTTCPALDVTPQAGNYTYSLQIARYSDHGAIISYGNISALIGQK